jgi:hypothetical protein
MFAAVKVNIPQRATTARAARTLNAILMCLDLRHSKRNEDEAVQR